jgi:hypothetical protein
MIFTIWVLFPQGAAQPRKTRSPGGLVGLLESFFTKHAFFPGNPSSWGMYICRTFLWGLFAASSCLPIPPHPLPVHMQNTGKVRMTSLVCTTKQWSYDLFIQKNFICRWPVRAQHCLILLQKRNTTILMCTPTAERRRGIRTFIYYNRSLSHLCKLPHAVTHKTHGCPQWGKQTETH